MIAIVPRVNSFSERWIPYCEANKIPYVTVDPYHSGVIAAIEGCRALLWHWTQDDYRAQLFARQLSLALEAKGIVVFPDSRSSWLFDDKVSQKYMLEALGLPLVPCTVFYDERSATQWANSTTYPKVFKLRGGAGSRNVLLVNGKRHAVSLIRRAFGQGFRSASRFGRVREAVWHHRRDGGLDNLLRVAKRLAETPFQSLEERLLPVQKGYVYFQEFKTGCALDDRFIVIGDRCICLRRYCREADFRASGSGVVSRDPVLFPLEGVQLAFETARKLKVRCLAVDVVYSHGRPMLVEVSYGFVMGPLYDLCPGYYDSALNWHAAAVDPQEYIIEDVLHSVCDHGSINRS